MLEPKISGSLEVRFSIDSGDRKFESTSVMEKSTKCESLLNKKLAFVPSTTPRHESLLESTHCIFIEAQYFAYNRNDLQTINLRNYS